MKLRFLGTGTSSGIPEIGCNCRVCLSIDPRDMRKRCTALLTTEDHNHILIDAGPDIRAQLLEYKVNSLDAVLITHAHYDHVIGLDELRPLSSSKTIPIYTDKIASKGIRNFFEYLFDDNPLQIGGGLTKLSLNIIEPFQEFLCHNISIKPLPVMHGRLPVIGYKFRNSAYLTDIKTMPEETIAELYGINTLVLNCLRQKEHPTHLNINEMLTLIKLINPKKCYLIHMNHETAAAEWDQILPKNIYAAYDGLEIEFE